MRFFHHHLNGITGTGVYLPDADRLVVAGRVALMFVCLSETDDMLFFFLFAKDRLAKINNRSRHRPTLQGISATSRIRPSQGLL